MYGPGDTFTSSVNPTGILVVKFSVLAGGRPRHNANHVEDSSKVGTRASNEPSRNLNYATLNPKQRSCFYSSAGVMLQAEVEVSYPGLSGWRSDL